MLLGFSGFTEHLSLATSTSFGDWTAMAGVVSNGSTTPLDVVPPDTGTELERGVGLVGMVMAMMTRMKRRMKMMIDFMLSICKRTRRQGSFSTFCLHSLSI